MKKTLLFAALPLALTLLVSCSGKKKEVAAFATEFAQKVQAGQIDSLKMVYPQIEDADSVAIKFVADNLQVEPTEQDGVFTVNYGNGVTATVKMDENGRISVLETKGLFAYPKEKMQFARKIGAIKEGMTDAEIAKRMAVVDKVAEEIYEKYSNRRKNAIVNLGSTITEDITYMFEGGEGYFTLKNTTDEPIKGSEYTITWEIVSLLTGFEEKTYETENGKDISANGTVRFPFQFSGRVFPSIKKITMKEMSNEEFMATYTPVGNEYEAYVKEHGDAVKVTGKKLGDGPYHIQGKIGGKYAVHMTLEKGMKEGFYYYDRSGASNTLSLKVLDFNPKTGKLVLEEQDDKGDVTGTFTGTLSTTRFTGKMTSYRGKTYNFDMAVTD